MYMVHIHCTVTVQHCSCGQHLSPNLSLFTVHSLNQDVQNYFKKQFCDSCDSIGQFHGNGMTFRLTIGTFEHVLISNMLLLHHINHIYDHQVSVGTNSVKKKKSKNTLN